MAATSAQSMRVAPVVSAEGLNVTFNSAGGEVHALSDVNLAIARGDFVSLIGPSGCGKTTLLRVIADLQSFTSGHVRVGGLEPKVARAERLYGYVFQQPTLLPWRNIADNVGLPLQIMKTDSAKNADCVTKQLSRVGLKNFARNYPSQLSGGMQQRASIARALSFSPELLLMDEPFGALDEITRDNLNLELTDLWRETGKTCVFVTHSISEAVFLSTHIVVMSPRPGRILEVIECDLPRKRDLSIRDTPKFLEIAARVRRGLHAGHANA